MLSQTNLENLAQWTDAAAHLTSTQAEGQVTGISTDTRSLKPGQVFLALKGENFDGHDYLSRAEGLGAQAVIVSKKVDVSIPQLLVKDGLKAFVKIAQNLRARFEGPVIAITGSAGKSSTKDMLAMLLGDNVVSSPASFNNLLGVSKTICLLEDTTESLVLEMGMNALGEIQQLCETFRPEFGCITNIGDAHMGKLGGPEFIFRAKKELFDYIAAFGKGVALNVDDPQVVRAFEDAIGETRTCVRYSTQGRKADVVADRIGTDSETGALQADIHIQGHSSFPVSLPIFGFHHIQNIVAAIACGRLLNVDVSSLQQRVGSIRPAPRRGEVHRLKEGRLLIDESYNSNPTALKSSLSSLASVYSDRRAIIVLGDMLELEDFSQPMHRQVAQHIANVFHGKPPGFVLGYGDWVKVTLETVAVMLPGWQTYHAESREALVSFIEKHQQSNDVILVKSSRGGQLDKVVDALKVL